MNIVKFYSPYNFNFPIVIETEKNVEVYVDMFNMSPVPDGHIRIIQLQEPLQPDSILQQIKNHSDCYTHILTFREDILSTNPKAKLFIRTGAWAQGYVPKEKKFSVSIVVGGKNNPVMEGYALRHDTWRNKDLITIPKEFYLSGTENTTHVFVPWNEVKYDGNLVLGSKKDPMFDCMFNIAIQNTSIKDYFTDILIDCFQTRTVPIYYGCRNISDYFNVDGVIVVNNLTEIINACNRLTPETYDNMLPAIEDNYIRSNNWCDDMEQLKIAVTKLINL